jgi:integrase
MGRPRKHNVDLRLPKYVRIRNGSYLYRDKKLCRVDEGEAKMYEELGKAKKKKAGLEMVPDAVEAFKLEYLPTLARSYRPTAELLLDKFADEFEEFKVKDVTAVTIRRSAKHLYGSKPSMAVAYKSRISRFFRWCVEEEGLREENPCREVWLKKPTKNKTKWTDAYFWLVRDKLAPMLQCYHDLSFLAYQRGTEIRLLMRSHIQRDGIHFKPTKTAGSSGAEVVVPITLQIEAVLERAYKLALLKPAPGKDAPVIQTTGGAKFTASGIRSAYRRAVEAITPEGMPEPKGLNPKALRPYAATAAKRQGHSIAQLQTGLAHASARTTEGYIHEHETPVSEVTLHLPVRPKPEARL